METLVGLFAETRGLLLRKRAVRVRLRSTSFPEGKFVIPAPLVRLPFGGPSVPEGSFPAVGWPQRGDLAPGSSGLAPGHQVALNWRGPLFFLVVKKAIQFCLLIFHFTMFMNETKNMKQ